MSEISSQLTGMKGKGSRMMSVILVLLSVLLFLSISSRLREVMPLLF